MTVFAIFLKLFSLYLIVFNSILTVFESIFLVFYCIWKYCDRQDGNQLVASAVSETRCPVCFARRERELSGGSEHPAEFFYARICVTNEHFVSYIIVEILSTCQLYGGAQLTFADVGKLPDTKDPLETGLGILRDAVVQNSDGLSADWKDFFDPRTDAIFWLTKMLSATSTALPS